MVGVRSRWVAWLAAPLLVSAAAGAAVPVRELWAAFDRAVWQLYVREWGSLRAICSSGAYWTDGVTTRLLTAAHCVDNPRAEYAVSQDGSVFLPVRVLAVGWPWDPVQRRYVDTEGDDWAVLEIQGLHSTMTVGLDAEVYLGMPIYVLGYPLGGDKLAAVGIVGNPEYAATGTLWRRYIGAQIFSRPGSSGSLVVNGDGLIIGILVAGAGEQLHLLTPIRKVRFDLADQGAKNGKPATPPLP